MSYYLWTKTVTIYFDTLSNLAGFRNLLVHLYWKVAIKEVFNTLQNDLWALIEFMKTSTKWRKRT